MKLSRLALIGVVAAVVTGCSSVEKERASGGFDYVNIQPTAALDIPQGLEEPEKGTKYRIPDTNADSSMVGRRVNITAPQQVRPIALGARVSESETETRVYFDIVDGMGDSVTEFVRAAAKDVLERRNIAWENVGENRWLTEQMTVEQSIEGEGGFLGIGGESESVLERTFRYELIQQTESHQRSTSLQVNVDDFSQNIDGKQKKVAPLVVRNLEADLLNAIISEVNREQQMAVARQKAEGIDTLLSKTSAGHSVFIVKDSFEQVWPLVNLVLEDIGFDVEDLNRESGTYFVEYSEPGSGFLFMGGDDYEALGIAEGEYEFRLLEEGEDTSVTVYQNDEVVSDEWVNKVFEAFKNSVKKQSKL
ncbi:outer membrane protein assembly factor BamC [Idiomarina sp. HP20-50]|uniref:outer membrane protein assembly factor BamC n=1 Tax=Idiomarina sp. HP20-50 TaxID=3070813 RepID=UPI00294AD89B|nr:outer membrane protein assembly factor BamC [Idiomarina sp. HP20-50]MDV6314951.1 outer membrane protein assembly factor BamC [Idiomarina sp. HP20-50]